MRNRVKQDPDSFQFTMWVAIASIGLIILSVALGVEIDPAVQILASP